MRIDSKFLGLILIFSFPSLYAQNWSEVKTQVFQSHCLNCHDVNKSSGSRNGATVGVDFNTFALATQSNNEDRAVIRAADLDTMPQSGALSADLQALLESWRSGGYQDSAPTANAGSDQNASSNSTVTLDASASSDIDGDSLSYSWSQESGTTVNLSDMTAQKPTFTSPTVNSNESLVFKVTVTVSDGDSDNNTATDTVSITVLATGTPIASAGDDQTVSSNASVTLNGSASNDPEGDNITYSWVQTSGTSVTLSDSSVVSPTFTAPALNTEEVLTFRLTVSDPGALSSSDEVNITVQAQSSASTTASASGGGGGGGCFLK